MGHTAHGVVLRHDVVLRCEAEFCGGLCRAARRAVALGWSTIGPDDRLNGGVFAGCSVAVSETRAGKVRVQNAMIVEQSARQEREGCGFVCRWFRVSCAASRRARRWKERRCIVVAGSYKQCTLLLLRFKWHSRREGSDVHWLTESACPSCHETWPIPRDLR